MCRAPSLRIFLSAANRHWTRAVVCPPPPRGSGEGWARYDTCGWRQVAAERERGHGQLERVKQLEAKRQGHAAQVAQQNLETLQRCLLGSCGVPSGRNGKEVQGKGGLKSG